MKNYPFSTNILGRQPFQCVYNLYYNLTKGQRPAFRKFLSGGDDTIAIHSRLLDDKLKSLHIYRCFHESHDNECICKIIEKNFSDKIIKFPGTALSTNDITNVSTLLTSSYIKQWKRLDLGNCYIRDAGLRIIHKMIQLSPITIEELWLNYNNLSSLSDKCIADIVITCAVKELSISYNKSVGQTKEFFPTILSSLTLQTLYIDGIGLSSKAAITIFTELKEKKTKLKKLCMYDNDVTDDGCDIIAATLQINSTLEHLYIHGNEISKEGSQLILNSLKHNSTLNTLLLPSYSEHDRKHLLSLQDFINEERKFHGCLVKLNVKFSS